MTADIDQVARVHCSGPRWPSEVELGGRRLAERAPRGGACWQHPLAFWCHSCLRALKTQLSYLGRL